jgi:beta-aspartyl-peptidase (threonine type)
VARAADAGWAVLAAGGSALDAVIAAVVVLEDDPHFNAGLGSVLTEDGVVELDASVMEGTGLRAGAVGAVAGVANPVRLSRALLEEGREVLLVGAPAAERARARGLRTVAPEALVTAAASRRWRRGGEARGETVGAVARDRHGRLAAATSTGGLSGKRRGRVGDSAVIGAGTYADDRVGAGSATGPGEAIIRLGLVRVGLEQLASGANAAAAARAALDVLRERLGAAAGLILADPDGRIGVAHTTPSMPAAICTATAARALLVD